MWVSLGGVLGGAAVAVVAPAVFSSILEYPFAIGAALALRPQSVEASRMAKSPAGRWAWRAGAAMLLVAGYWCVFAFNESGTTAPFLSSALFTWVQSLTGDAEIALRVFRTSLAIPAGLLLFAPRTALLFAGTAAGLLVGGAVTRTGGEVLYRERTFFGVHDVTSTQGGDWHVLTHGTTLHGVQASRGKMHDVPTAYYHPSGPIGDVVFMLAPEGRFRDVGVVGLGVGALAGYAGNGIRMDFFEVDEAVIRIAENPQYFTYLADARARPGARWGRWRSMDGWVCEACRKRRTIPSSSTRFRRTRFPRTSSRARPWRCTSRASNARRDRLPRVEPVFQPPTGAGEDRRGSAPRVLRPG